MERPLATFATAKGDCEDYAIAKYVALREAGFPQDDLQLVLVRDRAVRQDHAVLAAHLDDRWLILDNRRSDLIEDSDASSFPVGISAACRRRRFHLVSEQLTLRVGRGEQMHPVMIDGEQRREA